MNEPLNKVAAHRAAIRRQILVILKEAADDYETHGDPESDLRDAPEYLLTVGVARGLANAFGTLRYRLEHHATAYANRARSEIDVPEAMGKDGARFDIVLLNRANNVPRYIIELKRGTKILGDAQRIIRMAALGHGRLWWRHGFLVTILRREEHEATRIVLELVDQIRALANVEALALPTGSRVVVKHALERIGRSRQLPEETAIYGAVFQVSLVSQGDMATLIEGEEVEL